MLVRASERLVQHDDDRVDVGAGFLEGAFGVGLHGADFGDESAERFALGVRTEREAGCHDRDEAAPRCEHRVRMGDMRYVGLLRERRVHADPVNEVIAVPLRPGQEVAGEDLEALRPQFFREGRLQLDGDAVLDADDRSSS